MTGATGVVCMTCQNEIAQTRCPYCREEKFLCQQCFFAHQRLVHPDTSQTTQTLTQSGFTWKVTVSKDAAKAEANPKNKGKSRKQIELETVQKYIKENLVK